MFNKYQKIHHYFVLFNPITYILVVPILGLMIGLPYFFRSPKIEEPPKLITAQDFVDYSEKILANKLFGVDIDGNRSEVCTKALSYLNQGLKLDPNNAQGYAVRGLVQDCLNKYKASIFDLQKAKNLYQSQGKVQDVELTESTIKSIKEKYKAR
ncbi:hypothetical protein CEN49_15000 [Fischerella thermalis CCMEE 5273]|nr:hypothetical protein [Chlorogloeopsis fritschii]PMB06657.1 hypothetical protein CEN49_15000 [Fischerella thermalis CCMEE 5273]PMB41780.1 hypothetical protein CEN40_19280 [Fischerella thermalis CCMEE 5205]